MRHIILVCVSFVTIYSQDAPLENFYKSLTKNLVLKMNINFFHKQFGNNYNSYGQFYVMTKKKYAYETSSFIVVMEEDHIKTINSNTRQIIYSSFNNNQINIFDILSGDSDQIKFLDDKNEYINNFDIPQYGYRGIFEFHQNNGLLKSIKLNIDEYQTFMVEVKSIDFIEYYEIPDINDYGFEIVDLRE